MSGETEKEVSGWTTDTLREALRNEIGALRAVIDERDRRYESERKADHDAFASAHEASRDALQLARAFDNRMEVKNNEFRGQLKDTELTYIPRNEASARIDGIRSEALARIDNLEKSLDSLRQRVTASEGHGSGLNAGWGYLIGGVGFLGALIAIFYALAK